MPKSKRGKLWACGDLVEVLPFNRKFRPRKALVVGRIIACEAEGAHVWGRPPSLRAYKIEVVWRPSGWVLRDDFWIVAKYLQRPRKAKLDRIALEKVAE